MKLYYGNIITCDSKNSVYKCLVEDEGEIFYIGDDLPAYSRDCSEAVDLGTKALLPAFGDGHIHFSNWAFFNSTYNVCQATSIGDIKSVIKKYAEDNPEAKLLIGYGLSVHSVKEKRLISRSELDQAEKDRPVFLVGYDGRSAVVNTRVIGMLPLEMRSVHGFNLETGQLSHEAFYQALKQVTAQISPLNIFRSIISGIDALADYGVGLIHAVEGSGLPRDLDVDLVRFAARSAQMQFRIYFQTMEIKKVLKRKLPRIGGCFSCALDGSFGYKDAALLNPYADDDQNSGVLLYSDHTVIEFVKKANRAGLQVQLHCVGDAAVLQAVRALEAALEDHPRLDHRHTLIHACLIPEPLLEKIATLGIGLTVQPGVMFSPLEPPAYLEKIIGERVRNIWPLKKILNMGIHLSGGSDGPLTIPDPIEGIYAACNHPQPDHSLTVSEALRIYSYNVAYSSNDEIRRGSLEKGKLADMVILNKNPLELAPTDLRQLKVEKLILAGKEYQKNQTLPRIITGSLRKRGRKL